MKNDESIYEKTVRRILAAPIARAASLLADVARAIDPPKPVVTPEYDMPLTRQARADCEYIAQLRAEIEAEQAHREAVAKRKHLRAVGGLQ